MSEERLKLHEILEHPELAAEVRRRSSTGKMAFLGPPVLLRPVSSRWDRTQTQNPTPGVEARDAKAPTRGESKGR